MYFYSEVSMKRIALFFCFIFSFAAHANNII
ncbi:molecular chaperone, partial [Klebsiella pneumoniae]